MSGINNLKRLELYIEKMPSLPTSVTKIIEICDCAKTNPMDLNKIISLDPVLMGKILKLINSAYYGLPNQVTSLVRAIIMLGINTVKNLALSTAVLDKLTDKSGFRALNMEGFWRHSLGTAVVSKMIAKKCKINSQELENYFIAGLLHDIGKIPLNNILPTEYIKSISFADKSKISLYLSEKRVIDIDHSEVGGMISSSWKLDSIVSDTIKYHHCLPLYSGSNLHILETVIIADYYTNTNQIGFSGCIYPENVPDDVYKSIGITADWLEELKPTVMEEIEKASIFLKMKG